MPIRTETQQSFQKKRVKMDIRENEGDQKSMTIYKEPKSTPTQAFFNFMQSIFGIGVIPVPYTSYKTGYLWALFLLSGVTYACHRSTMLLLEVADELHASDSLLADVVRISLNVPWSNFANFLVVAKQVASCIAYIITSFVHLSFENIGIDIPIVYIFFFAFVVVIPLTLVSNMHFFHRTSRFGMVLAVTGVSITILYGVVNVAFYDAHIHTEDPVKIQNTFSFIGVAINLFNGIPTVLPVRNTLIDRSKFKIVFYNVMLISFIIVTITQQVSVLAFGPETSPIMMFSISNHFWQFIASVCFLASILLTYAVNMLPAVQVVESYFRVDNFSQLADDDLRPPENKPYPMWSTDPLSLTIRLLLTLIVFLFAYIVPSFSAFRNIVGQL